MFHAISKRIPSDRDLPSRVYRLEVRKRLLAGTFYDVLPYEYHEETSGSDYIKIEHRRPAVQYNLLRSVVLDSVNMVFSADRFPKVDCEDRTVRDTIADLISETRLAAVMSDAGIKGSVGSIAIRMRVLRKRIFFDVLDTQYLTRSMTRRNPTPY